MRKVIYHYQDTKALTRGLLEWIADPASEQCTELDLSGNRTLEGEVSQALVKSAMAKSLQKIEFHEIFFTTEQLEDILSLPALVHLGIYGGESSDWNGPRYIWDTLGNEHITVLLTSPHARRLRVLDIYNQNFSDQLGYNLRQALPDLKTLNVEWKSY